MTASWTAEQIIALAPDAASAKAGREQANARKWSGLGCDAEGAWGLCQGSGKDPYQAVVDLGEPAFKCSCPSRKFPCKHGLGLLLLWAASRDAFTAAAPAWVGEWRANRAKRSEAKEAKVAAAVERAADPAAQAAGAAQAAKRAAQRETRVDAAVEDLQRWIGDLLRHGIADLASKPPAFCADQARRLVDGQAPGLARQVRELGAGLSGADWQDRTLELLGRLHLQGAAWRARERLDAGLAADLRQQIGFSVPQEEVLATAPVAGAWSVVGRLLGEEEGVRTARCWLRAADGTTALILHFAAGNQPLDTSLVAGTRFSGEACFFPGASRQRALVRQRGDAETAVALDGGTTVAAAVAAFGERCAAVPWLERGCIVLADVVPAWQGERLWLRDAEGGALPVAAGWPHAWRLLAWSGGHPITLAGEYDGRQVQPLSAQGAEGFHAW